MLVMIKKTAVWGGVLSASLLLTACGEAANDMGKKVAETAASTITQASANKYQFTLADGPEACLKAFKDKLGADFKILKFNTFYVVPPAIDSSSIGSHIGSQDAKPGDMKTCDVMIQDPSDEKKALAYDMDTKTGVVSGPSPVELRVTGDAESFRLSDHVYPVANIDYAAIQKNIDAQKAKIEEKYSVYQVDGIRLDNNFITGKPRILVHINGRLKANDINKNILITLSPDGKTIFSNSLK